MKLNLGCGSDNRLGFINIDGNEMIGPDMVVDLGDQSLLSIFSEGEFEFVLANDIIEHLFHWQAVRLLKDIHSILIDGGTLELRLPDFEAIMNHPDIDSEEKIKALFGGQDRPQGESDVRHRQKYPEFYCHKFSYTKNSMGKELKEVGFTILFLETIGTNMVVKCSKEKRNERTG